MAKANHEDLFYKPAQFQITPKGGSPGGWANYVDNMLSSYDMLQIDTNSTPNFKKLKRKRLPMNFYAKRYWIITSDYSYGGYTYQFLDGDVSRQEFRGPSSVLDSDAYITDADRPDYDTVDFQAKGRLLDQLSQTKGSALVSGAEIDKTIASIASAAKRIAAAVTYLRRGNLGGLGNVLDVSISKNRRKSFAAEIRKQKRAKNSDVFRDIVANTWLEFSYGWKPLLADVYTQAENLANYSTDRAHVIKTVVASAKEMKFTKRTTNRDKSTWDVAFQSKCLLRVRYVVNYTFAEGDISIVNVFGLNNPMIIAWEVLPFSFVADWFLPVGNYLQSLTATAGLDMHSGTRSTLRSEVAFSDAIAGGKTHREADYVRSFDMTGGRATTRKYEKFRSPLASFPVQSLPSFKSPVSVSHAISAIALLQSVMLSKSHRPSTNPLAR